MGELRYDKEVYFSPKVHKKAILTLVDALDTSGEWQDFFEFHRQLFRTKASDLVWRTLSLMYSALSHRKLSRLLNELKTVRGVPPLHDLQATLTGIMLVLRYRLSLESSSSDTT